MMTLNYLQGHFLNANFCTVVTSFNGQRASRSPSAITERVINWRWNLAAILVLLFSVTTSIQLNKREPE